MSLIEKRKDKWKRFYLGDRGKTKILYIIEHSQGNGQDFPLLWPEYKKERIEWAWKNYLDGLERISWLEDDYLPYLSVVSGTEIFAEALGADVYRKEGNMPCAIPFIHSPEEAEKIRIPKLEDTSLMYLFEIADELKRRGGKDAMLKLPDIQSPMDVVAQIWDKSDLFPSMLEEPEIVKELALKVKNLIVQFLDAWFERYGKEYISHHPDYYMNGGITMSVDEIGTISPELFDEFFLDEINELSSRYQGIGIHCCADSRHQWENLKKIEGLRMLNLYRPEAVLDESYEYFKNVCAMWPGKMEHNIPEMLKNKKQEEYPEGSRIVIVERAETKKEAIELSYRLKKEYGDF